ncbi:hypothetical protein GCM10023176_08250 [Micromonospora coerulea]|uniref:Uncharacterized protein n=1 Tax=Micromonospora coerulea TaxID=47856 RepID=A0ABP8S9H0_9ACTN
MVTRWSATTLDGVLCPRVPHAAGASLDVVDQNSRVIYSRPVDAGAVIEFGLVVFAGPSCLFLLAVLTAWWKQKD